MEKHEIGIEGYESCDESIRNWNGLAYFPQGDGTATEFVYDGTTLGSAVYSIRNCPPEPDVLGELHFVPVGAIQVSGGFRIIGKDMYADVIVDVDGKLSIASQGKRGVS